MNLRMPESRLDGRIVNGRTYRDRDGSETLDLVEVGPGGEVELSTNQGSHTLIKGGDLEHPGALEGWARLGAEHALGVATLVLMGPNPNGTPTRRPGVVLRHGIEVGIIDPLSKNLTSSVVWGL